MSPFEKKLLSELLKKANIESSRKGIDLFKKIEQIKPPFNGFVRFVKEITSSPL